MRKAQGGINAAVLVAIIAGLIILYILFLPESEREALLENKDTEKRGNGGNSGDVDDVLLREFPGRLDTVEGVIDKTIPNIFLFQSTNAKELENINPIIVRNGMFDKKSRTVSFGIDDLENVDNVLLSFKANKYSGILTIKLNNEIVYENEIVSETVAPIRLNKNLLMNQNTLEFSVSSVGLKFWKTNEYSLEEIKVVGDITDRSKQESRNVFTLTGTELFNIESSNLRFVPYCKSEAKVGVLDVSVNGRNIFSAVPICEDSYRQPIPVGILNSGENKVIFKTNQGSYSVEQIKVEFVEKELSKTRYFFEVNQSVINDIKKRDIDAVLTIEFADDAKKRANLYSNGKGITLDTSDKEFKKILNDDDDPYMIKEGNNYIEIEPRTMLDIIELRVEVVET